MTCRDKEMAARVVAYQELADAERAAVDLHVAECDDCAKTFWALGRFVGKLSKAGEKHRARLAHPPEEQIIQLAVDPKLLSAQQRTEIQQHFERDRCVECERIYWSVLQSEKECAREAQARPTATRWQTFFLDWKKPAIALLLAFAVLQSIEIALFLNTKHQEAEYGSPPAGVDRTVSVSGPPGETRATNVPQSPAGNKNQSVQSRNVESQDQEKTVAALPEKSPDYLKLPADGAYILLLSAGRGGDAIPLVKVPASKLFVILQANLSPELGPYKKYRLVLQDGAGKTVKSDQVTQQDGTLNYLVHKELLKPGSYTLRVSGRDGSQDHYLAQFPFRIAATR